MNSKPLARIALLCTISGCLNFSGLLESRAPAEDGHTFDVIDAKPLAKLGAQKLTAYIEQGTDNAWLQGETNDKVVWKKKLPLHEEVNAAKTDVICRGGKIVVLSQFGFSAAYVKQTFSWDGKVVRFLSKVNGDHSQSEVDGLVKLATSGTRSQMEAWSDGDHNVEYPDNYINPVSMTKLLRAGARTAGGLATAKQYEAAANRMEISFDASACLVGLVIGGELDVKGKPEKWVQSWMQDCMKLPSSTWAPLLKTYAGYLVQAGKAKLANHVLTQINEGIAVEKIRQADEQKEAAAYTAKKSAELAQKESAKQEEAQKSDRATETEKKAPVEVETN